jgi:acetyl-CoA carboxylase biotin carboxyl carrier protein
LDLKEIKQIIDLMKRTDLSEFEIEEEGFKLRIRRGSTGYAASPSAPTLAYAPAPENGGHSQAAPSSAAAPSASDEEESGTSFIKSPMVGTFYRSPSPDNPAFVDVGSKVQENSPVCIIEAMKIMNEIQAEAKGTIVEVLVENGQPVEYGQRLFKIKTG